ncbi:MAG TPA: exodeoxyribonuclease VII small subunit [Streptosporangiaceae bacterium]|nr:exodeoxyribonuclease VII small subunit [Streptosporangiaceae bacterium]
MVEEKLELSYERARDELAEVVRKLEAGGLTLEESLSLWERGERLAAVCEEWLEGTRARLSAALAAAPKAERQDGPRQGGGRQNGGPQDDGRPETPF